MDCPKCPKCGTQMFKVSASLSVQNEVVVECECPACHTRTTVKLEKKNPKIL